MTVAMVLGMAVLGTAFAWRAALGARIEMAAAMFLPAFALLVLLWLGPVSPHLVAALQMALMLPRMVIVMLYRADEVRRSCTVRPGRVG